jgi:hypothetical protein
MSNEQVIIASPAEGQASAAAGPSAQHAETFSKALHAFLQPTVNVSETIRAVVAQQQALNQEIESLNQKMGYATGIASPQQQKQLETYVQKLRVSKQRIDALGKLLIGVKGRLWRVHTTLQARTKSLESDNTLLVVQLEQKVATDSSSVSESKQASAPSAPAAVEAPTDTALVESAETQPAALEPADVVLAEAATIEDSEQVQVAYHEDANAGLDTTEDRASTNGVRVTDVVLPAASTEDAALAEESDEAVSCSAVVEQPTSVTTEETAPSEALPEPSAAPSVEETAPDQEVEAVEDATAKGAKGGKGKKGGGKKR